MNPHINEQEFQVGVCSVKQWKGVGWDSGIGSLVQVVRKYFLEQETFPSPKWQEGTSRADFHLEETASVTDVTQSLVVLFLQR